jgi:hypothetical protein
VEARRVNAAGSMIRPRPSSCSRYARTPGACAVQRAEGRPPAVVLRHKTTDAGQGVTGVIQHGHGKDGPGGVGEPRQGSNGKMFSAGPAAEQLPLAHGGAAGAFFNGLGPSAARTARAGT